MAPTNNTQPPPVNDQANWIADNEDVEAWRAGNRRMREQAYGQPKKRIVSLPLIDLTEFSGGSPDPENRPSSTLAQTAAEELLRTLRFSKRAIVPDTIHLEKTSKDFFVGNKVLLNALINEGRRLGVSLITVGRILKIKFRTQGNDVGLLKSNRIVVSVYLELRLFDVTRSKEVLYLRRTAEASTSDIESVQISHPEAAKNRFELAERAVVNGMHLYAKDLSNVFDKLAWEGRIAKISEGKIYVNAGRASGLHIGDILRVVSAGDDIYDPVTGAYLGRSDGVSKGTLEIIDYLGNDASVCKLHSGGNFGENDIVQLY